MKDLSAVEVLRSEDATEIEANDAPEAEAEAEAKAFCWASMRLSCFSGEGVS